MKKFPFSLLLLATIPLFYHLSDIRVTFLALGSTILFLFYLKTNSKILLAILCCYLILAAFYTSELIKFPFIFQPNRLITNDTWSNLYIKYMQNEALYMPHKLRLSLFNFSVYPYVLMSKATEFFMLKNLYDTLLLSNLYPLFLGIISAIKAKKWLIFLPLLITSLASVLSNGVDIFKSYLLIAPMLIYLIFLGFPKMSKKIYIVLFIISLVLITSP